MCLAQGHNAMTPVRLEPAALRSRVKHSSSELPITHECSSSCRYIRAFHECSCFNESITRVGKSDKMQGLPSLLSLVRNEFNTFKNTRAQMLDSIDHLISSPPTRLINSTHVRLSVYFYRPQKMIRDNRGRRRRKRETNLKKVSMI